MIILIGYSTKSTCTDRILRQQTGLQKSKFLTLEEQVMIFIYVISQKATNRMAMEDW